MDSDKIKKEDKIGEAYNNFPPEIQDAIKDIRVSSNTLFSRGIDFVKWSTTISIAAIVWIATSTKGQNSHTNFYLASSLFFLVLSIIIGIIIVYYVFSYWVSQVEKNFSLFRFLVSKDEKLGKSLGYTEPNVLYFNLMYHNSEEKILNYNHPSRFIGLIISHLLCIVIGLLFYAYSYFA